MTKRGKHSRVRGMGVNLEARFGSRMSVLIGSVLCLICLACKTSTGTTTNQRQQIASRLMNNWLAKHDGRLDSVNIINNENLSPKQYANLLTIEEFCHNRQEECQIVSLIVNHKLQNKETGALRGSLVGYLKKRSSDWSRELENANEGASRDDNDVNIGSGGLKAAPSTSSFVEQLIDLLAGKQRDELDGVRKSSADWMATTTDYEDTLGAGQPANDVNQLIELADGKRGGPEQEDEGGADYPIKHIEQQPPPVLMKKSHFVRKQTAPLAPTTQATTIRVSAEEAKRFIQAQRGESSLIHSTTTLGPGLLTAPAQLRSLIASLLQTDSNRRQSSLVDNNSNEDAGDSMSNQIVGHESKTGPARLHRSETLGSPAALKSTNTTAGVGERANGTTTKLEKWKEWEELQCNKRRFTFRATKRDADGNICTGLITSDICYGACDTGEIADWLFPHKRSIHKVCRHGQRVRRKATLTDCSSRDVEESLRSYHYVDAVDCVCKKCASVDTTCLGTMTTPHLQHMDEALKEFERGTFAIEGD